MKQSYWMPDVLAGFEQNTLNSPTAADGPLALVLVRRRCSTPSTKAVLYIHGYVDYFFQIHLADSYNQLKGDFWYAALIAGLCMGSSRWVGRAMAGPMAPERQTAEFYSL